VLDSSTRSHVYLARDTLLDELRVLKMPSMNFAEDIGYLDSFGIHRRKNIAAMDD